MYTRYGKEKWQKERWGSSREGSFSSGSFLRSCECSLLTLLATSSASIPFPAGISQASSPNPTFLHLQDITLITRQCFLPVSPTFLSWSITPAAATARGWRGTHHRQGCAASRMSGLSKPWTGEEESPDSWCSVSCELTRSEGSCQSPLPGSPVPISLMNPKYTNIVICVLKNAATPELMKKVCFRLTPLKKPGFLLHSNFSKLAPLERIQMGWPTITYNSSKYQSSHMPCEGQIQSEDLYCSQVIQSRCQLQQVRVWKLAGITISESLQTFCSGIKGALFLFF